MTIKTKRAFVWIVWGIMIIGSLAIIISLSSCASIRAPIWEKNSCMARTEYALKQVPDAYAVLGMIPTGQWHTQAKKGDNWIVVRGYKVEIGEQEYPMNPQLKLTKEQYTRYMRKVREGGK